MKRPFAFVPSTFEERGTAVPFTTPVLAYARVRVDYRDRLELRIPNLAGGKGVYVVPWAAVPDFREMTVHDRALHDEITASKAVTPDQMRDAALRIASQGLAGEEAAQAAKTALEVDAQFRNETNLLIIIGILKSQEPAAATRLLQAILTPEGEREARGVLINVARSMGLGVDELNALIEELTLSLRAVGLPGVGKDGRLRRELKRLQNFHASIEEWSAREISEFAGLAAVCAEVANQTLKATRAVSDELDAILLRLFFLSGWNTQKLEITRLTNRLSWQLDGWDFITGWWEQAVEQSRDEQLTAVRGMFRVLPVVPREAHQEGESEPAENPDTRTKRWVRAFEDWRTGHVDSDLVRRFEALKAQAKQQTNEALRVLPAGSRVGLVATGPQGADWPKGPSAPGTPTPPTRPASRS